MHTQQHAISLEDIIGAKPGEEFIFVAFLSLVAKSCSIIAVNICRLYSIHQSFSLQHATTLTHVETLVLSWTFVGRPDHERLFLKDSAASSDRPAGHGTSTLKCADSWHSLMQTTTGYHCAGIFFPVRP